MVVGGVLCADAKANDKLLVDGGGHHVQLAGGVDGGEEHLVQLIAPDQAEAHQSHLMRTKLINNRQEYNGLTQSYPDFVADFEALVGSHQGLEALGEPAVLPHVGLQSLHAVVADDEPELERPKAATQWNAPMLKLK